MKAIPSRAFGLRLTVLTLLALLWAAPRAAAADDEPSEPSPNKKPEPEETSLDHRYQFGAAVRLGSGYRVIAPYEKEFCGQADKSVCGGMYPLYLEISPSFGITGALEVLIDFRLPLDAPDYTGTKGFFFSPGIKYYTSPESLFKFYLTGQVVFEFQSVDHRGAADLASFDFGVRSAMGLQFDLLRYVGLFAQAGVVFGFSRWFTFLADFAGGVQVRY